jgi:partner of Y14 and mago protein
LRMASQQSTSGIVTDETSGERHIPESTRADGSTRRAIRIRPGYRPPEDVELYKNRTAEAHRERARRIGIPGAESEDTEKDDKPSAASTAASKNAKRREARKRAKASNEAEEGAPQESGVVTPDHDGQGGQAPADVKEEVDPHAEKEKKARNIKKKLRQARELKEKKEGGEALLPEQIAKVIKITELIRELEALGFGPDGEPSQQPPVSTSPANGAAHGDL